jgi:YVTN family beta-propeller protein
MDTKLVRALRPLGSVLTLGAMAIIMGLTPIIAAAPDIPTKTQLAYVTNYDSNTVSVIATATNTVVDTVTVGLKPMGVAITPDRAFAYVANSGDNTVSVIGTALNRVRATIPVGVAPMGLAITPNGNFVYVANPSSHTISVITPSTNTVVDTIPLGSGAYPVSLAITPDSKFAYVADAQNIWVIATNTNSVVTNIGVGDVPEIVAVTPDGTLVYVACMSGVVVISTATNTVVRSVDPPFLAGATMNFGGIGITPDGTHVYVGYQDVMFGSSVVQVIATATNTQETMVILDAGSFPMGVSITPDGSYAYVALSWGNAVGVIGTATNTVVATTPVGSSPAYIAIAPVRHRSQGE